MNMRELHGTERILLISAKPAPNGGLHLGHIAGPYLRQDMIRRHYQSRGAMVSAVCGTDPIDSFVYLRADQEGTCPESVAKRYFNQIRKDFASVDIYFDAFIDPISPEWQVRFSRCLAEVVQRSRAEGRVVELEQPFPVDSERQRGVGGAWLCGDCPDCGTPVSGYFCESCGSSFDPSEMVSPVRRGNLGIAVFLPTKDLFFEIQDPGGLLRSLSDIGVEHKVLSIVERQFAKGRLRVRLTERSDWGIQTDEDTKRCYFGHGLLYGYCRLLGSVYQELSGEIVNPFDVGSSVVTVNLIGIDNTVSHMVNIQAIGEEISGWRGFDRFVVNRFYLLNGRKFSTSERHLIWVNDLIEKAGADSDAVRFVIAATSPTEKEHDLNPDEFLFWYNDVYVSNIYERLCADINTLDGMTFDEIPSVVLDRFEAIWSEACDGYGSSSYAPEVQVKLVLSWLKTRNIVCSCDESSLYGWLKCLMLLIYPIVPRLASWGWRSLGRCGAIRVATLLMKSTVEVAPGKPLAARFALKNFSAAMPN